MKLARLKKLCLNLPPITRDFLIRTCVPTIKYMAFELQKSNLWVYKMNIYNENKNENKLVKKLLTGQKRINLYKKIKTEYICMKALTISAFVNDGKLMKQQRWM